MLNRKLAFFTLGVFAIVYFLSAVSDILLPFIIGILISFLLDPIIDKFEERKFNRSAVSGVITILFFSLLFGLSAIAIPVIFHQIEDLVTKLPTYYSKFSAENLPAIKMKLARLNPDIADQFSSQAASFSQDIANYVAKVLKGVLSSGMFVINIASLMLIAPVVTFYMLRDWDKFVARIDSLLPREYAPTIRTQSQKINDILVAYLRGQFNVCAILAAYYGIGLSVVGLNSGFLIGVFTGFAIFIPYVGFLTGTIIALTVGYFQFDGDLTSLLMVGGVFGFGQILEGSLLTPKMVGDKIGVHPVWLIFGMLCGASLLGFVGVLLAVPLTAIVSVLVKFAIEQYESSDFYKKSVAKPKAAKTK